MIGGAMNEVIDSFIPWKDISKAYFQSGGGSAAPEEVAAPAAPPAPAVPAPALVEVPPEPPKAVQFDGGEESEEDSDDEPPPIALGDEVTLGDDDFDTEDDESVKLEPTKETVALNL
jgi:hypothetical protein